MTRGIVIVSCGADTDQQAVHLVKSLNRFTHMPVIAHQDPAMSGIQSRAVKLRMDLISPFDQTLFLDCDTLVQADPEPLFDLLDHAPVWMGMDVGPRTVSEMLEHRFFNFCLKPGTPGRNNLEFVASRKPDAPHWNSGVVLFKRCESTNLFFRAWRATWGSLPPGQDQVALVCACHATGVQPALLSPRWNYQHSHGKAETDLTANRHQIRILHLLGSNKPELYRRAAAHGFI